MSLSSRSFSISFDNLGLQEYDIKKHITIDEFSRGRRRSDGGRMEKEPASHRIACCALREQDRNCYTVLLKRRSMTATAAGQRNPTARE